MERGGGAVISDDLLASYAADAALEVEGIAGLIDGPRRHRGVRVSVHDGVPAVELYVSVAWGARAPDVGRTVQARVADYLVRTARLRSVGVDVVIDAVRLRA